MYLAFFRISLTFGLLICAFSFFFLFPFCVSLSIAHFLNARILKLGLAIVNNLLV